MGNQQPTSIWYQHVKEAQRLGVYSVPSSEGKREAPYESRDEDIVCSTGKPVAEGNLGLNCNEV
jgi:hypothetical protein